MIGPKPGETWKIGQYEPMKYIGVGRDFVGLQYLLFDQGEGFHFVILKDDFWSPEVTKQKVKDV